MMVDIALQTSNAAQMRNAITAGFGPGSQGIKDGAEWFADEIGAFYTQTGTSPDGTPIFSPRTGYYALGRWNGPASMLPNFPGWVTVVWRSDQRDAQNNPVPRPAWWTRIIL